MPRSSVSYTKLQSSDDLPHTGEDRHTDSESCHLHLESPPTQKLHRKTSTRQNIMIFALLSTALVLAIIFFLWKLPDFYGRNKMLLSASHRHPPPKLLWEHTIQYVGSESVVRLLDVNNDGAVDLILGLAQLTKGKKNSIFQDFSKYDFCKDGACGGAVVAWDGRTGDIIWSFPTYNEVFELNCGNIDINGDGQMDCLGAGRKGTLVSFDYKSGKLLWSPQTGEESYLNHEWNIYNPLVLEDVTGDGIPEILILHGGDPRYGSEITERNASRLLLLNASSGNPIGSHVTTPDSKELYSSPVILSNSNHTSYVLFGTGGETVPGSLWAINTHNLLHMFNSTYKNRTTTKKLSHLKTTNGFYQLLESTSKGVMVPAVTVDLNRDSALDVVAMSFDGILIAYNGKNLSELWRKTIPGAESYTTPGVGYFDSDDVPDIMVHWNYGEWPKYNRSMLAVHSGLNGSIIWSISENNSFSMTSPLVLRTDKRCTDLFLYRLHERDDNSRGEFHGVDTQRKVKPGEIDKDHHTSSSISSLYAVNWDIKDKPFLISSKHSQEFCYNYTDSANITRDKCTSMELQSRTTGALGDVDADAHIELAITYNAEAMMFDTDGGYTGSEEALTVSTYNLEQLLTWNNSNPIRSFLPMEHQVWTEYMGKNSLSSFKTT